MVLSPETFCWKKIFTPGKPLSFRFETLKKHIFKQNFPEKRCRFYYISWKNNISFLWPPCNTLFCLFVYFSFNGTCAVDVHHLVNFHYYHSVQKVWTPFYRQRLYGHTSTLQDLLSKEHYCYKVHTLLMKNWLPTLLYPYMDYIPFLKENLASPSPSVIFQKSQLPPPISQGALWGITLWVHCTFNATILLYTCRIYRLELWIE